MKRIVLAYQIHDKIFQHSPLNYHSIYFDTCFLVKMTVTVLKSAIGASGSREQAKRIQQSKVVKIPSISIHGCQSVAISYLKENYMPNLMNT